MAKSTKLRTLAGATLLVGWANSALAQPAAPAGAPPPVTDAAPAPAAPPAAAAPTAAAATSTPGATNTSEPAAPPASAAPAGAAPPVGWAVATDTPSTAAPGPQPPPVSEPPPPPPHNAERDPLSLIAIYYSTAAPVSDTRDFGGGFSWAGLTLDGRQRVHKHLAVGVSLAWQRLAYKSLETTTVGDVTVTGVQARQQAIFPMLATVHYSFRDDVSRSLPFVGLGVGGYYVDRLLDVGPAARFTDTTWMFGFAPEVGIGFPGWSGALMLACKFHYAFKTDDTPQQTYFNFNVGGAFDD